MCCCFFFFKQKTAYDMRITDWSSDVCSSDLPFRLRLRADCGGDGRRAAGLGRGNRVERDRDPAIRPRGDVEGLPRPAHRAAALRRDGALQLRLDGDRAAAAGRGRAGRAAGPRSRRAPGRSEEHTSELQSLMRTSYAVFCLKKKTKLQQ